MPKLKTHKGAKSRFHITASGKMLRAKGMKSHLRRNKSKRVKRQFDEMIPVHPANEKGLRKLLPYGTG